jgi:hypothetical protein
LRWIEKSTSAIDFIKPEIEDRKTIRTKRSSRNSSNGHFKIKEQSDNKVEVAKQAGRSDEVAGGSGERRTEEGESSDLEWWKEWPEYQKRTE